MARSARRRSRVDWVYRSYKWDDSDPTLQEPYLSGTYYNPITCGAGQESGTALVLVDSHDYSAMRQAGGMDAGGLLVKFGLGAPSQMEQSDQGLLIHGVDVHCHFFQAATSWFGTAVQHWGMRIIVAGQDPETGAMLMHPFYSMWENAGGDQMSGPDYWANGRQNCWEWRHSWSPREGTSSATAHPLATWVHAFPRFKRRLDATEGLFLWVEGHPNNNPGTLDLFNPFCRTLVSK